MTTIQTAISTLENDSDFLKQFSNPQNDSEASGETQEAEGKKEEHIFS